MEYLERAKKIRLVIFDIDGVLTDGKLFFDDAGREYKAFHARDGHGIKMLKQAGIKVAVISGRYAESVERRMTSLGVEFVFQGQEDKLVALEQLCNQLNIERDQVAHVGDDVLDLPVMRRVGLAVAVKDAHFAVKDHAHWITENKGGNGAGREVCDLVMRAQDRLDQALAAYL